MKFSIILPVYNSEKYIVQTIDSVERQTFKDFELIIIDDKSTDNSLKLIKKFKNKDQRISLIEQPKNRGVSIARNIGLERARGKYILFLDSDDLLPLNALSIYEKIISKNHPDIVQGKVSTKLNKNNIAKEQIFKYKKYSRNQAVRLFLNFKTISGYAWGKIYKRQIITNVRFPENITYGEDGIFFYKCLIKSRSVICANFISYWYRVRFNSLTGRGQDYGQKNLAIFEQLKCIKKETPENNKKYELVFTFEIYRSELIIIISSSSKVKKQYIQYYEMMKAFCNKNWGKVLLLTINPRIKLNVLKYIIFRLRKEEN